jgi:hypothetical protein
MFLKIKQLKLFNTVCTSCCRGVKKFQFNSSCLAVQWGSNFIVQSGAYIVSNLFLFIYLALPTRAGSPQQHMPITACGPFYPTHPVNFPVGGNRSTRGKPIRHSA